MQGLSNALNKNVAIGAAFPLEAARPISRAWF